MGSTTIVRTAELPLQGTQPNRPAPAEVRSQLNRLLASPLFQYSKHYPGLLRYVVHETLEGRGSLLKERALGVDVFGRDPDYDTNADPVVRTTAREVRKRLATYYLEAGADDDVRIDLPAGAYVPEFHFNHRNTPPTEPDAIPPVSPPSSALAAAPAPVNRAGNWITAAVTALVLVGLGFGAMELRGTTDASANFWNPVWTSSEPLMIAVGAASEPFPVLGSPAAAGPSLGDVMSADHLSFSDAINLGRLSGLAREHGRKKLDIRRADAFTLADLRKGPAILIGAFDNAWTMRLEKQLRYTFDWDNNQHAGAIRDRQNRTAAVWRQDLSAPYDKVTQDYALVTRVVDPLTEKTVIMVGGIGRDGALAAGEFLTEPRYLEMLASHAPKGWGHQNLQVVLGADIVRGNAGPPRILATYSW